LHARVGVGALVRQPPFRGGVLLGLDGRRRRDGVCFGGGVGQCGLA
jgi:hypothetical protein